MKYLIKHWPNQIVSIVTKFLKNSYNFDLLLCKRDRLRLRFVHYFDNIYVAMIKKILRQNQLLPRTPLTLKISRVVRNKEIIYFK